jgi:large subunit ribosomal protein L15
MADREPEPEIPILSRLRPPPGSTKVARRIGRGPGSGLGKTSGKGQKGQHARGSGKVRPGFEGGQMPLHRRLPKVGFRNPFTKTVATVNVGRLARFDAGSVVDPGALVDARLVRGRFDSIKVLGQGALDKALKVRAHAFSEGAKACIEKAGGSAEVIATTPASAAGK